jgi:23S rRNA pseudouridine1911/1915/1917 synthase
MIEVLFEDNHIIAVNKQSGDIVQGDKTGDKTLGEKVAVFLKEKYNKPGNVFVGVTHRIDRPVTGVVLFAKTSKALARLNEMFQSKNVQKTYWALVTGEPEQKSAVLTHYLIKNAKINKSVALNHERTGAKKSVLSYVMLEGKYKFPLLEVKPVTGRSHQIRAQLSKIRCAIVGDLKYGARYPNSNQSICLHAKKIEFIHPITKENIIIEAPLPIIWNDFLIK